jgi:3-oxoacyl-[acyl-carrier-protein] synthase II
MGVAASAMALKEATVTIPDAIITGTGYGCLEDTGTFLNKMILNNEEALNPTPFIQSTHNTIGSQIALLLPCQHYNQTYAHGAFSFESALLDALLQLSEEPEKNILAGGIDEITSASHDIQSRFGIFRKESVSSLQLFEKRTKGTLNGEGSVFFVLSGVKGKSDIARLQGVTTIYNPRGKELRTGVERFLAANNFSTDAMDLVLCGKSGDDRSARALQEVSDQLFPTASTGVFKHLCGEYPVASAFALWLGARVLKEQLVPDIILERKQNRPVKNILIFNQYFGTHYSLILISAC